VNVGSITWYPDPSHLLSFRDILLPLDSYQQ
jgi:hypothetical protein